MKPVYEKMSKSRGNVVLPEEVVYGVADLPSEYEFRWPNGRVIEDFKDVGVWRDRLNTDLYFTASMFGRIPVFLHYKGNPVPAILVIKGQRTQQHPQLVAFWTGLALSRLHGKKYKQYKKWRKAFFKLYRLGAIRGVDWARKHRGSHWWLRNRLEGQIPCE